MKKKPVKTNSRYKIKHNGGFKVGHGRIRSVESYKNPATRRKISDANKETVKTNKNFAQARQKINEARGEEHHNWKGENIKYRAIHRWLVITFGKADRCENTDCPKKSSNYQYALIKGKKYERKRENYKKFCVSCHKIYDKKGNKKNNSQH